MNIPQTPFSSDDVVAEQAMAWFSRLRADTVSVQQRVEFAAWLAADPKHQRAYQDIQDFWVHPDFTELLAAAKLTTVQVKPPSRLRWQPTVQLAMAASVLLMVCVSPNWHCWQADYCTDVGETRTVSLADGSEITLNSDTALNVAYHDNLRQIELISGEAYFSVQRNPDQPFLVASHFANTRVLGTRFLVRQDQSSDTVTVISGVVEVSGKSQPPIKLHADEQISVGAQAANTIQRVGSSNAVAWLKGHTLFDNAPLPEVLAELGRYRHGAIVLSNSQLKTLKVSGRFDIADTDHALQALRETLPIRISHISPWLVVVY